ncbi:MAG: HAD family hydrolase [Simkaniaceae bacterium]
MNRKLGLIFDCDGVLIDSEEAHFQSWKLTLEDRGFDLKQEEFFPFVGSPNLQTALGLARLKRIGNYKELLEEKHKHFSKISPFYIKPMDDTMAFLQKLELKKRFLPFALAIASAAPMIELKMHLDKIKSRRIFDEIISGTDHLRHYKDPSGVNKPKPYVYLEAAKKLNIAPERCIAFEDTAIGLAAAKSAGMFVCVRPHAFSIRQDFSQADVVLEHFFDLTIEKLLVLRRSQNTNG